MIITERAMTSPRTRHTATFDPAARCWRVTWLPGVALDHSQAVTAMTIAETVAAGAVPDVESRRTWPHLASWAGELGLTGPDVVSMIQADRLGGDPQ